MSSRTPEVVLLDHGMGNLRSVARAFERAGAKPCVTADPATIRSADRLVVPGVGALKDVMASLSERGLDTAVRERAANGDPYLGICLGLHILMERGEEGPAQGLELIPGEVARFEDRPKRAVPHMGWNQVKPSETHPVLSEGFFYFVHSYRAVDVPAQQVLASTEYGGETFASAIGFDACLAVQFHPEKSQRAGLALLEAFCAWSP